MEGLIWLGVVLCMMVRRGSPKASFLALGAVLAAGIGGLAYYNARITGSPFECPYALYRQDYGTPQSYWWQPPVIVEHFNHPELAANYENQLHFWERRYSAAALWDSTWHRARDFWRFFIGPFLTPAFLFAVCAVRRRPLRPWLWVSAVFILDHLTYHAWYPQQSASETVLIVLLAVEGWRHLRNWRAKTRTGLAVSRNLTLGFATAFVFLIAGLPFMPGTAYSWSGVRRIWDTMAVEPGGRETAIRELESAPGKHLVFVRYGPNHPWYDEWVFNGADIADSRIVFARACTPESDLALTRAMSDRDVWIASPDELPVIARATPAQLLIASAAP
jgi:hypothetical protein